MNPAVRPPARAGQFYESSPKALRRHVAACLGEWRPPEGMGPLVGGVTPHAGWVFSGPTAAKVFAALAAERPDTFVILGAVHFWHGRSAAVFPAGAWATPLGEAAIDEALAAEIIALGKDRIQASVSAHDTEHSIEVQVPFIQALCPEAGIVPVAVPPAADVRAVGAAVAAAVRASRKKAVVVASTDLTHYGMGYGSPDRGPLSKAMPWMRENDRRIIRLVESLRAEEIVAEAEAHANACGAGALASATAAAAGLGATTARLLEYTTSADVLRDAGDDRAVGYMGMVFEKKQEIDFGE